MGIKNVASLISILVIKRKFRVWNMCYLLEDLQRAVCWYLQCDHYWEDSTSALRPLPWGLFFGIILLLTVAVCVCYYVVWVACE